MICASKYKEQHTGIPLKATRKPYKAPEITTQWVDIPRYNEAS